MYPNTRFDKPGKSPFMDMDLVPKYADEESYCVWCAHEPDSDAESGGGKRLPSRADR
ncbi:heavy metal-binding domain-containing protein [Escherichia coli]